MAALGLLGRLLIHFPIVFLRKETHAESAHRTILYKRNVT